MPRPFGARPRPHKYQYTEPKLQDGLKWKRFLKYYEGNDRFTLQVAYYDRCPSRLQIERLIEIHGEHAADRT